MIVQRQSFRLARTPGFWLRQAERLIQETCSRSSQKMVLQVITHEVNLKTGAGLVRGDVLLNTSHHTAMYCGNGKEVEAFINEGTATGGKPGDQTGREFLIRSYRNYPWTHVLRYTKDGTTGNTDTQTEGHYMFEPKTVKKGDNGLSVLLLQQIWIARGFRGKELATYPGQSGI